VGVEEVLVRGKNRRRDRKFMGHFFRGTKREKKGERREKTIVKEGETTRTETNGHNRMTRCSVRLQATGKRGKICGHTKEKARALQGPAGI